MTKIKNCMSKIKEYFEKNIRVAVLILFLLELFISIWITPNRYDSAFFIEKMQEMSMLDFLSMRYSTWTSRIIIEFVVCTILPMGRVVWTLINTIMMSVLGYSILKLFVKDDDKSMTWMSVALIILYPLNKIATCDWGAGSINYTWPLAMLLFSAISIKKIFNEEKIKKYMYPLYFFALVFACNQEQSCVIAFGMYFVFIILDIMKNKKKFHPFLLIQFAVTILGLINIIVCPGNYARKIEETSTYYIDFNMLGIFDKFSLGLTSTINNLLISSNVIFLVFSIVSAVYIYITYKNNLYRVIAIIPLILALSFGIFKDFIYKLFPYLGMLDDLMNMESVILTPTNYINTINFVPLILSFIVLGSITLNILLIFKNLKSNVAIVIYVLGVMSRVAIGFSPTVFASTDRTFIFLDFSFIIMTILIWQEFLKLTDKNQIKIRERLSMGIIGLSLLQYLHILIYAFVSQM